MESQELEKQPEQTNESTQIVPLSLNQRGLIASEEHLRALEIINILMEKGVERDHQRELYSIDPSVLYNILSIMFHPDQRTLIKYLRRIDKLSYPVRLDLTSHNREAEVEYELQKALLARLINDPQIAHKELERAWDALSRSEKGKDKEHEGLRYNVFADIGSHSLYTGFVGISFLKLGSLPSILKEKFANYPLIDSDTIVHVTQYHPHPFGQSSHYYDEDLGIDTSEVDEQIINRISDQSYHHYEVDGVLFGNYEAQSIEKVLERNGFVRERFHFIKIME